MTDGDGMKLALRTSAWLILGTWTGAWVLFALVIAPTAFRVLPNSQMAGQLVGPVLESLHLYGIAAGVALAGLSLALRRGAWLTGIPLVLAALCGASEFGVTSAIDAIRPQAFGPDATAASAAQFARLHQMSRTLYFLVGAGLLALTFLQARADTPGARGR